MQSIGYGALARREGGAPLEWNKAALAGTTQ